MGLGLLLGLGPLRDSQFGIWLNFPNHGGPRAGWLTQAGLPGAFDSSTGGFYRLLNRRGKHYMIHATLRRAGGQVNTNAGTLDHCAPTPLDQPLQNNNITASRHLPQRKAED